MMPRAPIYKSAGATPTSVHSRLNKQSASCLARIGTSRAFTYQGSYRRETGLGNDR